MHESTIFYPMFVLASWTGLVLLLVPLVRILSARRGEIVADDFKFGESSTVPPRVSVPNRNYMNLLEAPMLFYVVCLALYVTAGVSVLAVSCAWVYVSLRLVHSIIHLTYNGVLHRLTVFGLSNAVLIALWVIMAVHVASITGA